MSAQLTVVRGREAILLVKLEESTMRVGVSSVCVLAEILASQQVSQTAGWK